LFASRVFPTPGRPEKRTINEYSNEHAIFNICVIRDMI
jgi:hypothetical protein